MSAPPYQGGAAIGYPVHTVIDGNLDVVDVYGTGQYGIITAKQINGSAPGAGTVTPDWFNVVTTGGADPTGATDSTAAINNTVAKALGSSGAVVYFPRGNFLISGSINVYPFMQYVGDGVAEPAVPHSGTQITVNGASTIAFQTVSGQPQQHVTIRDLCIAYNGTPGTGTGSGIKLVSDATLGSVPYCLFQNLKIFGFGGDGFSADGLIVSSFTNVTCQNGGARGFFVQQSRGGAFTSLAFTACYALANAGNGYHLAQPTYCSFHGCAADHNGGNAYYLNNAEGVALSGCGSEWNSSGETATASGFVFDNGSTTCTVSGCWTFQSQASGKAFWVTGSSTGITFLGCRPNTVLSGGQGWQIDAGSDACLIGCQTGGALLTLNGRFSGIDTNFGGQPGQVLIPKTSAPSSVGSGAGQLYVDGSGNLKWLSPGGTTTQIVAGP